MKNNDRVKSNILFNEIINKGLKISNEYFTLFYINKDEEKSLFGISVPKKVGNAVIRNKLKRQTREIIRKNKLLFKKYKNYIIIVKKKCLEVSFQEKENKLITLIGDIK